MNATQAAEKVAERLSRDVAVKALIAEMPAPFRKARKGLDRVGLGARKKSGQVSW